MLGRLYRAGLEAAKLVAMVATVFGACYGGARLYAYASSRAGASETAAHFGVIESHQAVTDARLENEQEWRRVIYDQVKAVAEKVGAKVVSPPPMGPEQKSDAPR